MEKVIVYTDGSSRGNPGRGGYGVVIIMSVSGKVVERGGNEDTTTNNRMEMAAAYDALSYLKNENAEIEIRTDSSYVLQGITKWVYGWEKNNWKTSTGDDVENQDLWKALIQTTRNSKGKIVWTKIKGHAGIPGNERADEIATDYADGKKVILFKGSLSMYQEMTSRDFLSSAPSQHTEKKNKKAQPSKKAYSYVSMVDGVVHTDEEWSACEKRVKGKKKALYKKVFSKEEEENLIQEWTLMNLLR